MLDPLRNVPPWWFDPVVPGGSEPALTAAETANLTRAVSDTLPPAQGGDAWVTGFTPAPPPQPPTPTPPWQMTYSFPAARVTFMNDPTGRIPLSTWTGWDDDFRADINDQALYLGPNAPTSPANPVRMFATYVSRPEVEVDFDKFGGGAPASNKITQWGYDSGSDSIYIDGNNGTGGPIQLRLVKA